MRQARALRISLCAVAFVMLSVAASQVSAQTTFTYTIGIGNSAVSGFSGPYATVTVNLDSTQKVATVTFNTITTGANVYLMGDGGSVAVNVNGSSFTVTGITATNSLNPGGGFVAASPAQGAAGNEDGFGSFNVTINNGKGFSDSVTTESFTLTNTSGGTWADASSVLTPNNQGNSVAIHLFVCPDPAATCTSSLTASATGFASNATAAVPEPASMLLFGSGLVALGIRLRRKARKNEVAA